MNNNEKTFKEILAEIERPENFGKGSWALPVNATYAEKYKYDLCQKVIRFKRENNLSTEEIARKLHLRVEEVENILFCHINKFELENILNHVSLIITPLQIEIYG
jgi:hypothetical protein